MGTIKVVRLGRFELPTSCFGGTRSIHLSYSRAFPLYHEPLFARIPDWRIPGEAIIPGVSRR